MSSASAAPFRQFVLKVHNLCDLACDHCYVYTSVDQSWRRKPKVMSIDTAEVVGRRIADHARTHQLDLVRIIFHGGEPLMVGLTHMRDLLTSLSNQLDGVVVPEFRIQTNAVRLTEQFCRLFSQYNVGVGVSLDGDRSSNDKHRRYADGRSSYDAVLHGVELLRRPDYRQIYAGILCTVDLSNDPDAVYESLRSLAPPRIDLLLPHATWDNPPRLGDGAKDSSHTNPYADWLIAVYRRWVADRRPIGVRLFESIESTLIGGSSKTEVLGLTPTDVLVIETSGEIEQVDALKVSFAGAPETGLHVAHDSLDSAAAHIGIQARRTGLRGLSATCRSCPVVGSCGGGYYPHRYSTGKGFDNPSVYCGDLLKLITHIARSQSSETQEYHHIRHDLLVELASGGGGAAAVAQLVEAQKSVNRLLLERTAELALAANPQLRPSWDLIVELDRSGQGAAITATLAHPYFRSWAVRVLKSAHSATALAGLSGLALAAAVRACADVSLPVPVISGVAAIPTYGCFLVAGQVDHLVVTAARGRLIADRRTARWHPVRTLHCENVEVYLEDTDPERDCYGLPVSGRLSERGFTAWQDMFARAWLEITRNHSVYAPGLKEALRVVTPLALAPQHQEVSATARDAFGALAAALPSSPTSLALILIHEFQHSKLGAVLDLYDLFDRDDETLYSVPWRSDPRPLEGLFQGTYAHIAVADYWRGRVATAHTEAELLLAKSRFAKTCTETARCIEMLIGSDALTSYGLLFANSLRQTLQPWLAEIHH